MRKANLTNFYQPIIQMIFIANHKREELPKSMKRNCPKRVIKRYANGTPTMIDDVAQKFFLLHRVVAGDI